MTSGGVGRGRAFALGALIAGALAFPIGSEASAETGAWDESAHAKARLVSAVPATGDAAGVFLGLEIKLDPGWKTYWRAPGEGGLPPRFDWSGSANLAKIHVAWPAPKRFEIGGMESVGYAEHVILPLEAILAKPGEPLALRLALQYAVCREICMLVDAKLVLDLPSLAQQTSQSLSNAEAIARFRALVPREGSAHGWRVAEVARKMHGAGAERREIIVIDIASDGAPLGSPELLIEWPGVRLGQAKLKPAPVVGRVRFYAPIYAGPADRGPGELALTLIDGARAGTFTIQAPR